jgi:hypothetical protein
LLFWQEKKMGRDLSKSLVSDQRRMRMMSLKVEGVDGSPSLSGSSKTAMTVADGGVGIYNLTLLEPFKRAPEVLVTAITDDQVAKVESASTSAIVIHVQSLAGALADGDVYVMVLGSDDPDFI